MTNLDKEEQELLDSYERGEWISDYTPERLSELQSYAKATLLLLEEQQEANLQKLITVLKDGKWHSGDELADKVSWHFGHTISEARKKGYSFETREVDGNGFKYRMRSLF